MVLRDNMVLKPEREFNAVLRKITDNALHHRFTSGELRRAGEYPWTEALLAVVTFALWWPH